MGRNPVSTSLPGTGISTPAFIVLLILFLVMGVMTFRTGTKDVDEVLQLSLELSQESYRNGYEQGQFDQSKGISVVEERIQAHTDSIQETLLGKEDE